MRANAVVLKNCLFALTLCCAIPSSLRSQSVAPAQEFLSLEAVGSATPTNAPGAPISVAQDRINEIRRQDLDDLTQLPARAAAAVRQALAIPNVAATPVVQAPNSDLVIDGLNHADQRLAGTGAFTNTQFSSEPPDQGLCVGNGFVLEVVNLAMTVYNRDTGARLLAPAALNQFFGVKPAVVRSSPPVFGDFLSDPRCHYDGQTNRFFLTVLQLGVNPATGNFRGDSSILIAVTQTGDPTKAWNVFRLTTTTHGVACPCFGDQPLIGMDANGLYLSTNSFSLVNGGFGGDQVYAMSKFALAAGALPPFVLRLSLFPGFNADGSLDASVHPAINTRGQERAHSGTEFFLSSFDITSPLENQVVVWALSDTAQLTAPPTASTKFRLFKNVIRSQVYGVPPDAFQKRGPLVLGPLVDPAVFEILATNEHRMQDVMYANGRLWSAVTTGLTSPGEDLKAGIAWFAIEVDADGNKLEARVDRQGYVAARNASVFFPAIAVNSSDAVAMGFSLSGPGYFPSAAYAKLGGDSFGPIRVTGAGVGSEDGFTGYPDAVSPPPPCVDLGNGQSICEARWGDYGAAAIDEDGSIWLANEYIGPRPRTLLANWGTALTRLKPNGN